MLVVVSPAKKLDFESKLPTSKKTKPRQLQESQELIDIMRDYSAKDLKELMSISDNIAHLNVERFSSWKLPFSARNARPAMFAFMGDVYAGLQAYDFDETEITFAQKNLRILSGLYGVLRPLDLIQPYRLEMGSKVRSNKGKNLYEFWGGQVADLLNEDIRRHKNKTLINLASNEYFRSVKKSRLNVPVITPQFLDWKNGQYKMISFFAKKARGMMSRYMVNEKIISPEPLKGFSDGGYVYSSKLSTDNEWVFTRKL